MAFKYKLKEEPFNVGDTKTRGGIKTTITDLDPETGSVTWDVKNVPAIDSTFKEFKELRRFITQLARDTEDTVIDDLADQISKVFNQYRTHIRKKYPKSYKRVNEGDIDEEIDIKAPITQANLAKANNQINNSSGLADYILDVINQIKNKEQEGLFNNSNIKQAISFLEKARGVDEISTSGAAGAYNTPYAFRKKGSKPDDEAYKELGYKLVKEKALPVVRKKLAKVPKAKKVASKYRMKMPSGLVSTLGYTVSEDATKSANIHKQGQHPGEDLGPGPKAGDEGVTDNAYTKQFKYKLVPKNKDGTYVQKGSGMVVKNLF